MKSWSQSVRDGLVTGSAAAVLSTLALAILGARQANSATGPMNAVSHWYWGEEAAHTDALDSRHTLLGFVTHHAAAVFWAVFFERFFGERAARDLKAGLVGGTITAAMAATIDYTITPKRFTPGYEKRLKPLAITVVYASIALGLALARRPMASGEQVVSG